MKKLFAILMSIMMIACFMPTMAFADGTISLTGAYKTQSTVNLNSTFAFDAAEWGYSKQDALTVTITNGTAEETGELTVSVTNATDGVDSAACFTPGGDALSVGNVITSIPSGETGNTATFTVTPNTDLSVGTHSATVKVSKKDDPTTEVAKFTVSFEVRKKTLKASDFDFAKPTNPNYDGSAKTATVTAKDAIKTEIADANGIKVKYYNESGEAVPAPTTVGTYTVKIDVAVTENSNCDAIEDLTDSLWKFEIKKATTAPQHTAPIAKTRLTYDGNEQELITAGTAPTGGTMKYKVKEDEGNFNTEIPKKTAAGTYTVLYKIEGNGNFEDVAEKELGTVTIAPREVTVEGGTYKVSKAYDGETTAGTAAGKLTVSGILTGDTAVKVEATPVAYTSKDVSGQDMMDVQIALVGEGKDNYKIKDGAKTINVPCEITPKTVGLAWSGDTGLKFGNPVNVTAAVNNAVSGEEVAVTVEGGKDGSVGTHTAEATGLTIGGKSTGNYQLPDAKTKSYTVAKADTVSGVKATFEVMYNDTTTKTVSINSFTGLPENIENPKIKEVTSDSKQDANTILSTDPTETGFALKAGLTEAAKDSTATWNVTISSDTHEDIIATVTVKVIAKKQLTISGVKMADESYTYGGAAVTYDKSAVTVAGAEAEAKFDKDTLEYIYAGTPNDGSHFETGSTAPTKAGSYTLTVKVPDGNPNYVGQQVINFTIAKKLIAKPAQADAVVYNGKAQTYAVVSTEEYKVTSAAQTNANTAGYDVTVALVDKNNTMWDDTKTDNLTQKFIIKKAPKIVVAASAKNIYVNGQIPNLTSPAVDKDYTVAGLLGSDELGGTITLAYQKDSKVATPDNKVVGTYDIVISGATAPTGENYEGIEFKNATLTIASQPSSGGGSYYPYTPSTPSKPAAPNLDKTKTDSTTALNAAATANKYDAAEQAEVKKILDKANADIKNAKTEAEVKAIEEAAQAEIDKILTTEEKATVAALDNVEKRDFETKSKVITRKSGKKVIRLTWTAPDGVDVDGYEIFRSTKKNSGFGTKPYFETTSTSYTNTKNLKPGKIYYYKVRAFVVINGERVYTDYSMKAFRTIK